MNLPFETKQRELKIKKEASTDPRFGCNPSQRPVDEIINYGIVNMDKPSGPTSHQVSDYVKKILSITKAGHSGTLDPGVTGVLPIALGNATRIVDVLLKAGKEYVGVMHLHKEVDEKIILEAIETHFTGTIKQLPPLKSNVKRQLRPRNIYYFDILEVEGKDVLFRTGCQAGTYIRKLIHDLGAKLKVGAHMAQLRRTKAGPFDESTLFTLQDLADAYWYYKNEQSEKFIRKIIQPVENAVVHLPKIWVFDNCVDTLCHGASLHLPGISQVESGIKARDSVALMTLKNELIALGETKMSTEQIMGFQKGLSVKTTKVFMKPDTYPKIMVKK